MQQRLNLRRRSQTPDAMARQRRRNHLGIVEDKNIPRPQLARQVRHRLVLETIGATTSNLADSRGEAGRSAIRSGGKTKSKSETRMECFSHAR
jgi:hypothetical protein